jgi:hypothetical protein
MLEALSTPLNRQRTYLLLALCAALAIVSGVIGISDNPPGVLCAFLSAVAFFSGIHSSLENHRTISAPLPSGRPILHRLRGSSHRPRSSCGTGWSPRSTPGPSQWRWSRVLRRRPASLPSRPLRRRRRRSNHVLAHSPSSFQYIACLTPHCSGLGVSRWRSFLLAAELDIVRRRKTHP